MAAHPAIAPLTAGVLALLGGDPKGLKQLESAALMAPDSENIRAALGVGALAVGDESRARELLSSVPAAALYFAMAQSEGPGGLSRAQTTLVEHAKLADARVSPGALFLTALAFANAGQPDRADEMLSRAVKLAPSALDEVFAPDPGAGCARFAVAAIDELDATASSTAALAIARKLTEAGRVQEARAIAEKVAAKNPAAKRAARHVVAAALSRIEPRRALEELELVLADDPADRAALVAKVDVAMRLNDFAAARRAIEAAGAVEGKDRATIGKARAKLAIDNGNYAAAVEAAQDAAAANPKSNEALVLLCRALLGAGKVERALAFANQLLARKPTDVDPFSILAAIAEAKGEKEKTRTMKLRSEAFRGERERIDREIKRREAVLSAVRDAESGLGIAGLEAIRGEQPLLALPIDLATAKSGTAGFKRAARDRIIAACKGEFSSFLRRRGTYERIVISIAPYGKAVPYTIQLTGADPARCTEIPQRAR